MTIRFLQLPLALLAALTLALVPSSALARHARATAVLAARHARAPSSASARVRDAASTRAYIEANYTLVRTARANLAAAQAAIKGLGERVSGECPLAAPEAPQDHEAEQLSNEVVGALEVVAYEADKPSMLALAHAIRGLRWSNHKLTRMVHTYATKLEGFPTLALPDICADVKAWTASGYATLPATTVAFDKGFSAFSLEAEEVSLRLLRPYESATEASLLRRTKALEEPLAEFEAEAVSDYSKILDSLKLPQ